MIWRQKLQSMEWKHFEPPMLKNVRVQKSGGKVLASVFRDSPDIIFIDYLRMGKPLVENIIQQHLSLQSGFVFIRQCNGTPIEHFH